MALLHSAFGPDTDIDPNFLALYIYIYIYSKVECSSKRGDRCLLIEIDHRSAPKIILRFLQSNFVTKN